MKQATLKTAGTAVLGVAMAAAAAGSAAAAAPGGIGGPATMLTNGALTGAATGALGKVPATAPVTEAVGNLNPAAGKPAQSAPAQTAPAAQAAPAAAPATEVPAAEDAPAGATRVGGLESVPGGQGLAKTPVGSLTGTLTSLSPTGGGAPSLPGLGG
ncbi:hypothetical protein [Kitasatospora camelliae]|uniref:ATP-binding protein n=1 Tax=Kitasatospora camelliae TaxID=3156397 RepID=A0AAU8JXD5_9ACTN